MTITLTLLALRARNPAAEYVIWSRIDQKAVLKSILAAALTPLVVDTVADTQAPDTVAGKASVAAPAKAPDTVAAGKAPDTLAAGKAPDTPAAGKAPGTPQLEERAAQSGDARGTAGKESPEGERFVASGDMDGPTQLVTNVAEIERLILLHRNKVSPNIVEFLEYKALSIC